MIGTLPTLAPEHLTAEAITAHPRYALINEQIFAARGEDLHIAIDGPERLDMHADTIAPEAACTSTQFHLQVSPQDYAAHWNAAQCIAGVQVALGANSPFLFGKELWRETRIPLFEQATDTRPQELKAQGVRPRVWFGERFITSVFDHFEENVRYFPALLPVCDEEDPVAVLDRGDIPRLSELRMHNGTIYRWNRPVYDIHGGKPHLRIENRVLPAGPIDRRRVRQRRLLLRAAAHPGRAGPAGVVADVVRRPRRRTSRRAPGTASTPSCTGRAWAPCRSPSSCCGGCCRWPSRDWPRGTWTPPSATGCWAPSSAAAPPYRNGAEWQVETFHRIEEQKQPLDRRDALREMLRRYSEHMHANLPVADWPQTEAAPRSATDHRLGTGA